MLDEFVSNISTLEIMEHKSHHQFRPTSFILLTRYKFKLSGHVHLNLEASVWRARIIKD